MHVYPIHSIDIKTTMSLIALDWKLWNIVKGKKHTHFPDNIHFSMFSIHPVLLLYNSVFRRPQLWIMRLILLSQERWIAYLSNRRGKETYFQLIELQYFRSREAAISKVIRAKALQRSFALGMNQRDHNKISCKTSAHQCPTLYTNAEQHKKIQTNKL